MLFNTNWLKEGQMFPPKSEIPRLKGYKDNYNLFNDSAEVVLEPYTVRFKDIIKELNDGNVGNYTLSFSNYWQPITLKTADLAVSDKPNISIDGQDKNKLELKLNELDFDNKLYEMIMDIDIAGECVARAYKDNGEKKMVIQDISMWYPIVNNENVKEIKQHVFAWVVCTYQDANNENKNKYQLHVQIHDVGKSNYLKQIYDIKSSEYEDYIDSNKENFGMIKFYKIGKLIEEKNIDSGIVDGIVHFTGITTSKGLHGIPSYDRITPVVAELSIRKGLRNFILDKNAAPRMAAPSSAFVQNKYKQWVLKTGGRNFVVEPGGVPPVYITWDGSLQANDSAIAELKEELRVLSEVGTLINENDINSSQGYDALEIKLTNAKAKVQRMCTKITKPMKKLLSKLLDVDTNEISIVFNNGLPSNETQNLLRAKQALDIGISRKTVLQDYMGLTEDKAEEELEQSQSENADYSVNQFGISQNPLYGG